MPENVTGVVCSSCGGRTLEPTGICAWHFHGREGMSGFDPRANKIWCDYFSGVNTDVTDFDLGWIVALLEGEGCFTADRHSTKYETRYPRITLAMIDEDVVRRAAALLGCRSVMGPYTRSQGGQPMFRCVITGRRAEAWMRKLQPHMGLRRAAKIQEILDAWGEGHQPGNNEIARCPEDPVDPV